MLGVDRLDMIKGIPQKLLAFEKFLEENPEWRDMVLLVQIAVPSRTDVPEYQARYLTASLLHTGHRALCECPVQCSFNWYNIAGLMAHFLAFVVAEDHALYSRRLNCMLSTSQIACAEVSTMKATHHGVHRQHTAG